LFGTVSGKHGMLGAAMSSGAGSDQIPQLVGFARVGAAGTFRLPGGLARELTSGSGDTLCLAVDDEVKLCRLTVSEGSKIDSRESIPVPGILGASKGDLLCFIERPYGAAIKQISIRLTDGETPTVSDHETATTVERVVSRFPSPEILAGNLNETTVPVEILGRAEEYWRDRVSLEAVIARRVLGRPGPTDEEQCGLMVARILTGQRADGSIGDSVVTTAKAMEELLDLGASPRREELTRAAEWLLDRSESPHNPGMFFLTDRLAAEQVKLVERRSRQSSGPRERFRQRKRSEMAQVEEYDPVFGGTVCGPRIMWPNALAMHALLRLGYEQHERMKRAINTIAMNEWCECGWQHGITDWIGRPEYKQRLERLVETAVDEFRQGGIADLGILADTHHTTRDLRRIGESRSKATVRYSMRLPTHIQSCEVLTTFGVSRVSHTGLRRIAEAHLWRFAALLHNGMTGHIDTKGRKTLQEQYFEQVAYQVLRVFADYDHPAARLGTMLAIPWLEGRQHPDGSWGSGEYSEAATLSVVRALCGIASHHSEGVDA
jgi:hypothetical protein